MSLLLSFCNSLLIQWSLNECYSQLMFCYDLLALIQQTSRWPQVKKEKAKKSESKLLKGFSLNLSTFQKINERFLKHMTIKVYVLSINIQMSQRGQEKTNEKTNSSPPSVKEKPALPKKLLKFVDKKPAKIKNGSYMISPKSVFRSPLEKFKFDVIQDKEKKNWEITNHCNYGFNYSTIRSYALLLRRFVQMYDIEGSQLLYNCSQSGLFRLNDGLPIEFGGFSPAIDQKFQIMNQQQQSGEYIGDALFNILLADCCKKERQIKFPLIEFARKINDSKTNHNQLSSQAQSVLAHITDKYQRAMKAILKRNEQLGIEENQPVLFIDKPLKPKQKAANIYDQIFQACKNSTSQEESHSQKTKSKPKFAKEEKKQASQEDFQIKKVKEEKSQEKVKEKALKNDAKRIPTAKIEQQELSKREINEKREARVSSKRKNIEEKKQRKEVKEQDHFSEEDNESKDKRSVKEERRKQKHIKKHKREKSHHKKHKQHKKHKKHGKHHK